jgi:cytochrome c-type biogenesis protein CcmH/NrfG
LQINPTSDHARNALKELEARTRTAVTEEKPAYPPLPKTPPAAIPPENDDPLAALRSNSKPEKGNLKKTRSTQARRQTTQTRPQRSRRYRPLLLAATVAAGILLLLIAYIYINRNQSGEVVVENPTNTPEATTTVVETTAVVAVTTTEAVNTTAATTPTTAALSTTTVAGTTTATVTTAATTTPATAATTVVPGAAGTGGTAAERVEKLLQTARQSVGNGDYKAAISSINEALSLEPRNVPANLELGNTLMRAPNDQATGLTNRFEEAVKAYQRVTEQAPTWSAGWARLGEALNMKGDVTGAIKALSRSLELDSNGPERWLFLATLYERNNQSAEATYARQRAQGISVTPPPGAPR